MWPRAASLPSPKTHCLHSLGLTGSGHFPRDTLGSSRVFGSLFHLSWDCLWVLTKPSSSHCYCGWRACCFLRVVLEVKDFRTKGNLWGTELCLLGTFSRQFLEIIPEALYICVIYFSGLLPLIKFILGWLAWSGVDGENFCLRQWSERSGFQVPQAKVGEAR